MKNTINVVTISGILFLSGCSSNFNNSQNTDIKDASIHHKTYKLNLDRNKAVYLDGCKVGELSSEQFKGVCEKSIEAYIENSLKNKSVEKTLNSLGDFEKTGSFDTGGLENTPIISEFSYEKSFVSKIKQVNKEDMVLETKKLEYKDNFLFKVKFLGDNQWALHLNNVNVIPIKPVKIEKNNEIEYSSPGFLYVELNKTLILNNNKNYVIAVNRTDNEEFELGFLKVSESK